MKLSIIVPVYNVEAFLPKCLDSLLAQTIGDFEIILVNDGSPDNSQQIIDRYVREHPDKIRSLTVDNGGQGRARNFGLNIAQGDYIGFIDSDDWIAPDMYEKLCTVAESEAADIVICDMMAVYSDGREELQKARFDERRPMSAAGSSCNKLFRSSLIAEQRFPENRWYEDFAFSAKMLLKSNKTVYLNEALYFYRCGQLSTMHNNNSLRNLEIIDIMEDIGGAITDERQAEFEALLLDHVLLDTINRVALHTGSDKKQVLKKLRSYVNGYLPQLTECTAFKEQPRNRRIVMWLNYRGLYDVSKLLLAAKRKLAGR